MGAAVYEDGLLIWGEPFTPPVDSDDSSEISTERNDNNGGIVAVDSLLVDEKPLARLPYLRLNILEALSLVEGRTRLRLALVKLPYYMYRHHKSDAHTGSPLVAAENENEHIGEEALLHEDDEIEDWFYDEEEKYRGSVADDDDDNSYADHILRSSKFATDASNSLDNAEETFLSGGYHTKWIQAAKEASVMALLALLLEPTSSYAPDEASGIGENSIESGHLSSSGDSSRGLIRLSKRARASHVVPVLLEKLSFLVKDAYHQGIYSTSYAHVEDRYANRESDGGGSVLLGRYVLHGPRVSTFCGGGARPSATSMHAIGGIGAGLLAGPTVIEALYERVASLLVATMISVSGVGHPLQNIMVPHLEISQMEMYLSPLRRTCLLIYY